MDLLKRFRRNKYYPVIRAFHEENRKYIYFNCIRKENIHRNNSRNYIANLNLARSIPLIISFRHKHTTCSSPDEEEIVKRGVTRVINILMYRQL